MAWHKWDSRILDEAMARADTGRFAINDGNRHWGCGLDDIRREVAAGGDLELAMAICAPAHTWPNGDVDPNWRFFFVRGGADGGMLVQATFTAPDESELAAFEAREIAEACVDGVASSASTARL